MLQALKKKPLALAGAVLLACATVPVAAGHLNVVLKAQLDGREEVNTAGTSAIVGDPNGRGEAYVFGIDADPNVLCYVIVNVTKVAELDQAPGNGRAAHIHFAPRGQNGPVVVNLHWPQGGQAGDCVDPATQPDRFPFGGQVVQAIKTNPQNYYVNIHNTEYPAGVIRGQLQPAESD